GFWLAVDAGEASGSEGFVQGIVVRFFGSNIFPSARFVSSTLRLFRLARIIGVPACSANPRSSFFLSFPSHDRSVLHSIKNDLPSLMQTRSMGFDCAALITRYPSLRKISLILYSSLLPVS